MSQKTHFISLEILAVKSLNSFVLSLLKDIVIKHKKTIRLRMAYLLYDQQIDENCNLNNQENPVDENKIPMIGLVSELVHR